MKFVVGVSFKCFVVLLMCFKGFSQEKDSISEKETLKFEEFKSKAKIQKGLFNIYRHKKDIYFEIPDSLLAKDMLIVNKISKVPYSLNGHGLNKGMVYETKMVRFYKDTLLNKIWLKIINPKAISPKQDAISLSVKDNFIEATIEEFDIKYYNTDSTAVLIKVNKVFNGKQKSFSDLLNNIGLGGSIKTKLSKIDKVKAFPLNVIVKSDMSTEVSEGAGPALPLSIGVTINIVLLPETPMQPRFADDRIGYFSNSKLYFNDEQHQVEQRNLITRWRLEPKTSDIERYKKGELVEPKKQIVYYIDPATPLKWRKAIKQGIEDWQKAFEQAGFKNAIIAKETNDDDFDGDDVRYSMITYAASERKNAMGPSVIDPRTGEILEADVIWWHNLMVSLHSWMRVQTGTIDPNARANKFSDEHMASAIRFVSSHEVGHTFGLKHNMGASYSFPVDSLRSKTFTDKMGGTAPSIMDYARFNYVAQPGDNITSITPKIVNYDTYAINWGYRWLGLESPKDELPIAKQWIRDHENDPLYFYGSRSGIDPRSQSEDLGDDAVKASEYGIKNLKIIVPNIINWSAETGEDYYQSAKLYKSVIDQWDTYTYHVMMNIGGVYLNNTVYGDNKKSYEAVPKHKQEKALDYLLHNAIAPQKWLFTPELIGKTYFVKDAPDGKRYYSPYSVMRSKQSYVLYNLLKTDRLLRMIENEMIIENDLVFTAQNLLDILSSYVFNKTKKGKTLDIYDRMTQKNYIDILIVEMEKLSRKKSSSKKLSGDKNINIHYSSMTRISDVSSLKRGALSDALTLLNKKKNKGDRATKMHYADLIARIKYSLNN